MLLRVLFILALALIVGPFFVNGFGPSARLALVAMGFAMLIVVSQVMIIARLYRKAGANMAFIRTGMGGARVVKDGGTIVIPVVHQVIPVSLETTRLRVGHDTLLTAHGEAVDFAAEFYVRVRPETGEILKAAITLGGRADRPAEALPPLVLPRLVAAFRTAAAQRTLVQLHAERDGVIEQVRKVAGAELSAHGLMLESITISAFGSADQAVAAGASLEHGFTKG
jgi:flotillin